MFSRKIYITISWIILLSLSVLLQYVKQYDGRSAWGTAVLFLPVIAPSAIMELIGISQRVRQMNNGHTDFSLIAATPLACSVIIYYFTRALII